jgi:anaphase-promoting complex subunit 4
VLGYINETMKHSGLDLHLQKLPELKGVVDRDAFFKRPVLQQMSYESTRTMLKKLEDATSTTKANANTAPLNLQAIAVSLSGDVRLVLDRITTWQSKMLPSSKSFDGPAGIPKDARACDIRMNANRNGDLTVGVLLVHEGTLYLHTKHSSMGSHELQSDATSSSKLLDARFVSNTCCITLRQSEEDGTCSLGVTLLESGLNTPPSFLTTEHVVHIFSAGDTFHPEKILVGGRKDKEVCVVFGDGGKSWRVYDLSKKYVDAVFAATDVTDPGDDSMIF